MEVAARPAWEAGAVQPRSWGWGSGSGNVPWPEGAAPVPCPSHGGFLFFAHFGFFSGRTRYSFTAQRAQREEEPFSFSSSPSPLPAVPGVVVQRGPAYRLCQASRSDVT